MKQHIVISVDCPFVTKVFISSKNNMNVLLCMSI